MIEIVAQSEAMQEAVGLAERVAATDANVLVTGESGAGKDVLAFRIHSLSPRSMKPFVKIDCATLPGELLEAELFGYERGAFTSATESKPGRLEAAHKGTLVLDEIAYLSKDSQAKLLRVIETREFERLGGRSTLKVDARLIALTNVDLSKAVARRDFREDLFYRLNVVHIHLPPLRERAADLPAPIRAAVSVGRNRQRPRSLAEVEAEYLEETLAATGGNKAAAARILGISRKNLYERLERLKKDEG